MLFPGVGVWFVGWSFGAFSACLDEQGEIFAYSQLREIMPSSCHFKAELSFLPEQDGGRLSPPCSGYRPQIQIGEESTSCKVESDDVEVFELGEIYVVGLTLMFPERYLHRLSRGDRVVLLEGDRKVAAGRILELE